MDIRIQRDSRFEFLRLISIFAIVLHHLVIHTSVLTLPPLTFNRTVAQLFDIGGKVGVNCFILLTGYFQCCSSFKSKKLFILEKQVYCYTLLPLLAFLIFQPEKIGFGSILQAIFPVSFHAYWYISAFFGLYVLSPFVNIFLNKIQRRQHMALIVIMGFMLSVVPTFFRQRHWFSEIGWFLFLYVVGAYIRIYKERILPAKRRYGIITMCLILVTWGTSIALSFLEIRHGSVHKYVNIFSENTYSAFTLAIAVSAFLFIYSIDPFYNGVINRISKHTLGVYLFQSNPLLSPFVIWPFVERMGYTKLWCIRSVITVLIIITFAGCLDMIITSFIGIINPPGLDKLFLKIDRLMNMEQEQDKPYGK